MARAFSSRHTTVYPPEEPYACCCCYCCYFTQASQVCPSHAVCWPGQNAQGEPHARTACQPARAWTKDHDKNGVQLYRVLCHHHTPPPGSRGCSAISPANDSWRSVNRIWLDRMDGGMWISEVCGTSICRDTPAHHTPRYIHMYVIMLGVAVTWPHAVGTLSPGRAGGSSRRRMRHPQPSSQLHLNHVRHPT